MQPIYLRNFREILIDWDAGQGKSTCQMQYDAADKKTDQEDPCFVYLRGN